MLYNLVLCKYKCKEKFLKSVGIVEIKSNETRSSFTSAAILVDIQSTSAYLRIV